MPRGPVITPRVRALIAKVHYEHADWSAKEVQAEVVNLISKTYIHKKLDWPGISAVQKVLQSLRESPNPKDNPWNLLTLSQYELPADALPSVLQVWVHTSLNSSRPLTIREANWVARFYRGITNIDQLTKMARSYSFWEYIGERYGSRFVYPVYDYKVYEAMSGVKLNYEQINQLFDKRLIQLEGIFGSFKQWDLMTKDSSKLKGEISDNNIEELKLGEWWEVSV